MHLDVLFVVGRGAQEFTARVRQYPTITRVKNSREVLFPLLFLSRQLRILPTLTWWFFSPIGNFSFQLSNRSVKNAL